MQICYYFLLWYTRRAVPLFGGDKTERKENFPSL